MIPKTSEIHTNIIPNHQSTNPTLSPTSNPTLSPTFYPTLSPTFSPTLSPNGKSLVYGTRYEDKTALRIRELSTGNEKWLAFPIQKDDQESQASMGVLPNMTFTPDSKYLLLSYGGKINKIDVFIQLSL